MAAKKRQSKPKSNRGGRRAGAGRKSKEATKLREEIVAESDKLICDHLPQLIANMIKLADGGYQRVEEKFEPGVSDDESTEDDKPAPKAGLVLVERRVSRAEPDRAANQYLIDRVLGKPKQAVEMSGPNGGSIPLSIEQAIAKVYGETSEESRS